MRRQHPDYRAARRGGTALAAVLLATGATLLLLRRAESEPAAADLSEPQRTAQVLAHAMAANHLSRHPVDDLVSTNAFDLYIGTLDFDRTYFLASDIAEFRQQAGQLDDQLRAGDFSFAFKVFNRLKERVHNRVEFVDRLLDKGLDVKTDETYRWKRKDAPWPADEAAWDDLWRRKVLNDYVARKVALALADEKAKTEAAKASDDDAAAAKAGTDEQAAPGEEATTPDAEKAPPVTPEEFVRKRYHQFEIVLQDSDEQWVLEKFFNAFTQSYDPHSEYFSPSRTEDFDINMRLSLVGIGALLSTEDGAAKVERLIPGGPAERDGRLKPGDRIVAVGQGDEAPVDVLHWPLYKTVRLIRGEKNTKVVLVVWPASDVSGATEKKIDLSRDEVKLEEQAAHSDVREVKGEDGTVRKLGIITLPEFYADFGKPKDGRLPRRAARDVAREIKRLETNDVSGILLDLRNNGGGSLADAVTIAGFFIDSGPIVQVKDRRGVHVLSDPDPEEQYGGPLVVLVNRMSASASEIVAGALQDYGRAVIVGDDHTHGKGTVQSLLPLDRRDPGLGTVKLTTASFYRIDGASTQIKGVAADVTVSSVFDAMKTGEQYLEHALPWSQVSPAFYTAMPGPSLDGLRERSSQRREEDPRYRSRAKLLQRVSAQLNAETVSLNFDKRLAMARDEARLEDLQRELDEEETPKQPEKDLVLSEALQVLSDVAAGVCAPKPAAPEIPLAVR